MNKVRKISMNRGGGPGESVVHGPERPSYATTQYHTDTV